MVFKQIFLCTLKKKLSMKKIVFLSIAVLPLLFASCGEPAATVAPAFSLDSVKAAIAASNKVYGESFAKNDSVAFVGCYTSDGILMAPGMPALSTSDGIKAFFTGGYAMGIRGIDLVTSEVNGNSEMVHETGTYNVKDGSGNSLEKGKFIVIWKNVDGVWKMHRDIYNSDAPPPPPPPPAAK
jgi:ketosteroid isomerase-like protein